ncbi:MAG: OadG family protein [bacterium]
MLICFLNTIDTLSTTAGKDSTGVIQKAVNDTVKAVSEKSFSNMTFDFSNIESGNGTLITIVGLGIVFMSLALLTIFLVYLTKTLQFSLQQKQKRTGENKAPNQKILDTTGEIDAAISLALHLSFSEQHDLEDHVLTISKVQKMYSPWSSKIYGLRNFPRK